MTVSQRLKIIASCAYGPEIGQTVTSHSFRVGLIQELRARMLPLDVVKRHMGYKTISMVDRYSRSMLADDVGLTSALDGIGSFNNI